MNKIQIKTIELPQFIGKPIQDVYDYVKETYPEQLPYDDIDFYDNEVLKDSNYHFLFGSVFRDPVGYWGVPSVRWDGGSFRRYGSGLGSGWDGLYRVVLQTTALELEPSALTLESLDLRVKALEVKNK